MKFGKQTVGTTGKSPVVLTNSGGTPLLISGFSISGANPGDFNQTNNCPSSLAAGKSCSISVTFTPTRTGSRAASLNVMDNMKSGSQQVALSGTGN